MQQIDRARCFTTQYSSRKIDDRLFACESENIEHIALADFFSAKRDQLIEHRFGVAQAPFRAARDRVRCRWLQRDLFFFGNKLQVLRDEVRRDSVQIEPLTAAQNSWQNFLWLSGRENKFHMLGRFFQRLQERIERCRRKHVHLVDQINFVTALGRGITNVLPQLTHIFYAVVARSVDLDNVQTVAASYLLAVIAFSAWRDGRAFNAIERLCQNPGSRCLADAARPHKEIGVGKAILRQRIFQRARDMRLPNQIIESLGSILSGENLVTHAFNLMKKLMVDS